MPPRKKRTVKPKIPVIDLLPGLLVTSLANHDDFIVTCDTDSKTGAKKLHIITGKFITPRMLRKLIGQVEAQHDEGSSILTRDWQ